jgi:hypothetical protein
MLCRFDPKRLADLGNPDVIMRNANFILNKLSITNFDKLLDDLIALGIDGSEELLDRTVDLILSKAQMEEHFCSMYANLCLRLSELWSSEDERGAGVEDAPKTDPAKPQSLGSMFRTKLLTRCQEGFEINRAQQLEEIEKVSYIASLVFVTRSFTIYVLYR